MMWNILAHLPNVEMLHAYHDNGECIAQIETKLVAWQPSVELNMNLRHMIQPLQMGIQFGIKNISKMKCN